MRLFKSQIEAQRFLLQMVPKGYHWWIEGRANSKADLENRHQKYAEIYGVDLPPAKRAYQKKKGLAQAHFVAAPLPLEVLDGGYTWFLLATDGLGSIRENSKLKNALTNAGRVVWDDYVMYEAPRHRLEGGGMRWSWYLHPQTQKELDYYVGQLLKTAPHELKAFFESQCRRPMHHGIRHYLSRLLKKAHQNFCRMYPGKPWPARDPLKSLPILNSFRPSAQPN